jgi:hypothetical protein
MIPRMNLFRRQPSISDRDRAILGFLLGLALFAAAVQVFTVNSYDFENMQRGFRLLVSGVNPWSPENRIPDFYNPPFAVLFMWPMLFAAPKAYLVAGGALLFALVFYRRAWAGLAWFATNTALWIMASGGIDMFVIGAGLCLLFLADGKFESRLSLVVRVLAYGLLMVKPQGSIYIVALYILLRRDWKGLALSVLVYGVFFLPLYPSWLDVLLHNPPLAQTEASHTLWAKFGLWAAGAVAVLIILARRWKYWELGGALAGILTPYGMPGLPIFITLTGVKTLKAIPIVVIWSGCLAVLTWVTPPPGIELYDYISPFMAIYHLSMLGLALVLACLSPTDDDDNTVDFKAWFGRQSSSIKNLLRL